MNKLFELFKDEIHWPEVYEDAVWLVSDEELVYNKEANADDLETGNGETYGGYIKDSTEKEGYAIFEVDSGCGFDYQIILKLSNKVSFDD